MDAVRSDRGDPVATSLPLKACLLHRQRNEEIASFVAYLTLYMTESINSHQPTHNQWHTPMIRSFEDPSEPEPRHAH